jgi:alpha-glucosidase (family GH31 glycosyl hydrolase)
MNAKLMVSIWPVMRGECPNQVEMRSQGFLLGNDATYDAFNGDARALYWKQANEGWFRHGVDAWWCDCTEPFEADWKGTLKPSLGSGPSLTRTNRRPFSIPSASTSIRCITAAESTSTSGPQRARSAS